MKLKEDTEIIKIKNLYYSQRKKLEKNFFEGKMNGLELAHSLSRITDNLIKKISLIIAIPEKTALLAVGGFGRRELMPFSDLDLWVLVEKNKDEKILNLFYVLWDMGFKVSYCIENPNETIADAIKDSSIMTTLIDVRFIIGDKKLFQKFSASYKRQLKKDKNFSFYNQKIQEQRKRHESMGHARYLLEPNVKESVGALRDLNMLEWIGRVYLNWSKTKPFPVSEDFNLINMKRFQKAKVFLLTVRAFLHFIAGRAEEILSFSYQQKIAPLMGYAKHPGASPEDRLMKHYYLITREIRELTVILFASMEKTEKIKPFSEPIDALIFLKKMQKKGEFLSPEALKKISDVAKKAVNLQKNPKAIQILKEIITEKNNPEYILRILNENKMLVRILPQFRKINARPQRDIYHIYTVDEHSLKTLGFLNSFRYQNEKRETFISQAAMEIENWQVLSLAALFHDIGKNGFLGHAETGAQISFDLAKTFLLSEMESEKMIWLVRNHLIMNNTAFHRDLTAKETIEDFATKCQNVDKLNHLLLLSVADLMAVAPNVWTNWKASLLQELYTKTKLLLQGAEISFLNDDTLSLKQMKKLAKQEMKNFSVQIVALPKISASKVTVYAKDSPGLIAKIVGAMTISGASIISAKITTSENEAMDTFLIQEKPGRYHKEQKPKPFIDEDKIKKLKQNIEKALLNKINIQNEIKKIPQINEKPTSVLEKRVIIDNKASALFSVIDINCLDRYGLLYFIANKLTELNLNIISAYITTYGNRVVDTFYVQEINSGKIKTQKRLEEVIAELYKVLDCN